MKNVDIKIQGDTLIITVDLTKDHGKSSSGKTNIVASTEGFTRLNGNHSNVSVGLNVVKAKR
jgi:uracil phosphoribosyltransferase